MKTLQQYLFRFSFALLYFIPFIVSAQDPQDVDMADSFRSDGKIYIVIGVITIILAGLFVYLFMIEKKVAAIEKKLNKSN